MAQQPEGEKVPGWQALWENMLLFLTLLPNFFDNPQSKTKKLTVFRKMWVYCQLLWSEFTSSYLHKP